MMAADPAPPAVKPIVVISEGPDEARFYESMCRYLTIGSIDVVKVIGRQETKAESETPTASERRPSGKDDISNQVVAIANDTNFRLRRVVAIIRDGDNSPKGAFDSAADALAGPGWPRPAKPGRMAHGERVNTAALVINGNLEQLCVAAAKQAEPARSACVDAYLTCVWDEGVSLKFPDKSWAYAYLAQFGDGAVRVGEGADKGSWPLNSDVFADLRQFLTELDASVRL